ncbi:hypothetical protein LY474_20075 [Myxococcus stipitatus]|uniref:hypothetical protein n=1 Tax=Myxococcus stipitatus TaxID=83455 RepID=UPI001F1F03FA|nr:hypothetical protein [Myxococcus stipitatus]MCE9670099.1 hypothetical protein [Myxococcus stipitatus]
MIVARSSFARDVPDDTVRVWATERFHTPVGYAVRAQDLSSRPPYLLVPDAGGFIRKDGIATPDGYVFTGVPVGTTYYLGRGSGFTVTDARTVDLGMDFIGREGKVSTEVDVLPLDLQLSNLAPWVPYGGPTGTASLLEFVGPMNGVVAEVSLFDEPATGQTQLSTDLAEGYSMFEPFAAFESAKGDGLYVSQLGGVSAGTTPDGRALYYSTPVRGLALAPFDFLPDGVTPLELHGGMQPVPTRPLSIDWRVSEFVARATQSHPSATPTTPQLLIEAGANRVEAGWLSYSGTLLSLGLPSGSTFDFSRNLAYGLPYPESWLRVGAAHQSIRLQEVLPDGSNRIFRQGVFSAATRDVAELLAASPIRPRISPVRALTIDGLDAWSQRQVSGESPVLAWLPPELGTPTGYKVTVSYYDESVGFGRMIPWRTFSLPASSTQLRLPPGTLQPHAIHRIQVTAMDIAGHDPKHSPYYSLSGLPQGTAEAYSALLTTP